MRKIFKILSVITALTAIMLSAVSEAAVKSVTIPGWSTLYMGGPVCEYELEKTTKPGNSVLHVNYKSEKFSDRYARFNTSVPVEKGKTYIYGLSLKSSKSARVSLRVDWSSSFSALPKGATFDWTEFSRTFTAQEDKNVSLGILLEDKAEIWADDFFCYEYTNGKRIGPNLVLNGGFDSERTYDLISYKNGTAVKLMVGDEPASPGRFIDDDKLNYYLYTQSSQKRNMSLVVYYDGEKYAEENFNADSKGNEYSFELNGLEQGDHELVFNVIDDSGNIIMEYKTVGLYRHAKEEFLEKYTRRMGMSGTFNSSRMIDTLGKLMRLGTGRYEYGWQGIEKEKGIYTINSDNMDYANENGVDVISLLDYNNTLYADGSKYGMHNKENIDAYVNYCLAIQKKAPYLKYFEIWNEPNGANWWYPKKNPTGYSYMAEVAGQELRRVNENAKTLVGVVANGDSSYVNNILEAGLYPSMDIVANHPYIRPAKVDVAYDRMLSNMTGVIMRHGGWKEQIITEVGWPTVTNGTTWEQAAIELAKQGIAADYYDIQQNQYYMWGDITSKGNYNPAFGEDNFGVISSKRDGVDVYKPSVYSIKTMTDMTNGAIFCGKLYFNNDDDIAAYAYARDGVIICAVWSKNGEKKISFDNILTGLDMNGNEIESGKEFTIEEKPIYLKGLDKQLIINSLEKNSTVYMDLYLDESKKVFSESMDKKGFDKAVEILREDAKRAKTLAASGNFPSEEEALNLFKEHYENGYKIIEMYQNGELEISEAQLSALLYLNHWSGMLWNAVYILAVDGNEQYSIIDNADYDEAIAALNEKAGEHTLSYSSAILKIAKNYKEKAEGVLMMEGENELKAGAVKGWSEMCNALSRLASKMIEAESVADDNIIIQLPDDETDVDLSVQDTVYVSAYNYRKTQPLSGRIEIVSPKGNVVGKSEDVTINAGANEKVPVNVFLLQIDSGDYKMRFIENEKEIVSRKAALTGNPLYEINIKPIDTVYSDINSITVNVQNMKDYAVSGKIIIKPLCDWELESEERSINLDASQSSELIFNVSKKTSVPFHFYPFSILIQDKGGNKVYEKIHMLNFTVIKKADSEIDPQKFDGEISDWEDAYPVYVQFPENPLDEKNWVGGNYTRMLTKWDENYFYMLFDAYDFNHANVQVASSCWNGDAIQIGIDTLDNGGMGYSDDDYEYGIAKTEIDGIVTYAFHAPADVKGGRKPDDWLQIKRDENEKLTRYLLRIPKDSIKPLSLSENTVFGMDILVADANLTSRDKYAGLANAIADGKKPDWYWSFKLVSDTSKIESDKYPPIPVEFNTESVDVSDSSFKDISGHWAENDIKYMKKRGFISGKSDEIFAPEATITRAEFVTMLMNVSGKSQANEAAPYSDVDSNSWYAEYVNNAYASGFISENIADEEFFPDKNIIREEAIEMLNRYYSENHSNAEYKPMFGFSDCSDISPWAAAAFQNLYNYGVVNGNADGTLNPKGTLTRAEAVVLLKKGMN